MTKHSKRSKKINRTNASHFFLIFFFSWALFLVVLRRSSFDFALQSTSVASATFTFHCKRRAFVCSHVYCLCILFFSEFPFFYGIPTMERERERKKNFLLYCGIFFTCVIVRMDGAQHDKRNTLMMNALRAKKERNQ